MQEHHIYGPPGTGKTTELGRWTGRAVEKFGPDGVTLTSFTRTAAKELASRINNINPDNVGTLHALCYHGLGRPELTVKKTKYWNESRPEFALSGMDKGALDEGGDHEAPESSKGDECYRQMQIFRARMHPRNLWPVDVQRFASQWDEWKSDLGLMDFTDLIEIGADRLPFSPGRPAVLLVDEAQDLTPLQLNLVRKWGAQCEYFVLVGDDDQTIYSFTGATPETFFSGENIKKHTLTQSYRVPRAVHARAVSLIQRVGKREPKEYAPKDVDGQVLEISENYRAPEGVVQRAWEVAKAGESVMVLASCSYMLTSLTASFRRHGIPFHNPYRRRKTAWNPLHHTEGLKTAGNVLAAFLRHGPDTPYWSVPDFVTWADELVVGGALLPGRGRHGLKELAKAVENDMPGLHTSREVVAQIMDPKAIEPALSRNPIWLLDHLKKPRARAMAYPMAVNRLCGLEGLEATPKITIGTIHSVKGAQAEQVFLFPDISYAAETERWRSVAGEDDLLRLFYVGMTRAKKSLHICAPALVRVGGIQTALRVVL